MENKLFQRILLPTDFSENAAKALSFAATLASKTGGHLYLYHSYTPLGGPFVENRRTQAEYNQTKEMEALGQLRALEADIRSKFPALTCSVFADVAPFVPNLLKYARDQSIDLIVTGTVGATGMRTLIGSNASRIVQNSELPVLLIPNKSVENDLEQIAFASDYHRRDAEVLQEVCQLADLFNSSIRFFHLIPKFLPEILLEKEQELFDAHVDDIRSRFADKRIEYQLIEKDTSSDKLAHLTESLPFDLLVLISQKKNFFQRLFEESFTQNLTYISEKALLIYSGNERRQ